MTPRARALRLRAAATFSLAALAAFTTRCTGGPSRLPAREVASTGPTAESRPRERLTAPASPDPLAPFAAAAAGEATPAAAPPSYLEGTARLESLFRNLSALEGAPEGGASGDAVRILQYGDSHTAGDLGVSVFRRALQARFGDGGRGFVPLGRPWKGYWQDGLRTGMSEEFAASKIALGGGPSAAGGAFGLLGVGIETTAAGALAWTDVAARSSHVEIDYWRQPRGGSFDVLVDDVKTARVTSKAAAAGSGFFGFDVPEAPHKVTIRTAGDGPVRVFGMTLDRGRGVVVDALGIVGAQISTPLRWREAHFEEQVARRAPSLVILAYGTNEAVATTLTDAEYEQTSRQLLGRVARAAPGASCLLLGPPDLARRAGERGDWTTVPRLLEIVAMERRIAAEAGCAFYDQLAAMGGAGSIATWAAEPEPRAREDRVHLRPSGYAQIATSFAADLLHAYDDWSREH